MQIIPAIDIIEGKCVRLTEGDYAQKKIYNEDPLEVAKQFEGVGLMRLHLVDLDGAKAGAVVNWKVLEKIANKTNLVIDFGGGIKTESTLKTVLDTGATYATIGSLAVKERAIFEQWIEGFGAEVFMLGADVYEEKIAVGGWLEKTEIDVYDFKRYENDALGRLEIRKKYRELINLGFKDVYRLKNKKKQRCSYNQNEQRIENIEREHYLN